MGGGGVFFVGFGAEGGVGGGVGVRTRGDVLDGGVFEDSYDGGGGFLAADFDGAAGADAVCFVFGAEVEGGLVVFVVVRRRAKVGC